MQTQNHGGKPVVLVLSGNSGAGKTTLAAQLQEQKGFKRSISCTTRPPRPGEVDGIDYHFVSEDDFDRMIAEGKFLEYAGKYGKRYGTPVAGVHAMLEKGHSVILTIETEGYRQICNHTDEKVRSHLRSVFVWADNETLSERMRARGGMDETEMARRLSEAQAERDLMCHYDVALKSAAGPEEMFERLCGLLRM